jgi:hypothetical protein
MQMSARRSEMQSGGADFEPPWRAREFFRLLGISVNAGYAAIKRGEIPVIEIGRCKLIPRKAGRELLERGSRAA